MRRGRALVVALLISLALVAHWGYWYRSREHIAAPDVATPAGALYLAGDLPHRVWLPYPHQNLGRLEQGIGSVERFAAAVSWLTDRKPPRLPSFGSARVPPASELTLAVDDTGERFVAVARVYPLAGFLARWAGRLAGNPLLAGGAARIDGREVVVRWDDGSWIVSTPGVRLPTDPESVPRLSEALAWARLATARGLLPAGEYRLDRVGAALELVAGPEDVLLRLRALDVLEPPVPLLLAELATADGGLTGRSLALLPGVESLGGLPGAVTLHRGSRRWKLPGERLLKLLGDGPPVGNAEGWRMVALERESLRRGDPLGGFLNSLSGSQLSLGVWIDLPEARRLVDQTVEALEAVPVVGPREARRWRHLAGALDPLVGFGRLSATVVETPATVRVRLGRVSAVGEPAAID